jgi:hypothetical protein
MIYTESQGYVLSELPKWFSSANPIALLAAPAGYGKTFIVKGFLDRMGRRCKPLILAETNEAVNVLRNSVGSKYTTKTVCSAFNLILTNIEGEKQVVQHVTPDFSKINLIIIDEVSMLSRGRLKLIIDTCFEHSISLLLIGHSSQLPPIEERNGGNGCNSPAFIDSFYMDNSYDVPTKFYLSEPVRNTTNIFNFCNVVESLLHKRGVLPSDFIVSSSFLASYLLDQHGVVSFREGKTVCLAYSNKKVYELNTIVRKALFGTVSEEQLFIVGDRLICRQPTRLFPKAITDKVKSVEGLVQVKSELLTTNTKSIVLNVGFKEIAGILCWELLIHSNHFEKNKAVGYIYYPLDRNEVVALFMKYNNFAIWDKSANRQKKFDLAHTIGSIYGVDSRDIKHDLRHGYAMTVDQSQGSTIDNVIVDDGDIKRCIRNRTLEIKVRYVGYSRAKIHLWRLQ